MKHNFEWIMGEVFGHEGGYTNDKADPGNWTGGQVGKGRLVGTKYGITGRTLEGWRRRTNPKYDVTSADVRNLAKSEAWSILKSQYWDPIKGDDLPDGLDYAVFDLAVNAGPAQAAKILQRVLGVAQDGQIGNITLGAAARENGPQLIVKFMDAQDTFKRGLKKLWRTYGKGWTNRMRLVSKGAQRMAQRGGASPAEIAAAQVQSVSDMAGGSEDDLLTPAGYEVPANLPKAALSETALTATSIGNAGLLTLAAAVVTIATEVAGVLGELPQTRWVVIGAAVASAIGAAATLYLKLAQIRVGVPQ